MPSSPRNLQDVHYFTYRLYLRNFDGSCKKLVLSPWNSL